MKVKSCFGRYGDKDSEIHFKGEKPKLNCTMSCPDFSLCRDCYYSWWKHRRPREGEVIKVIKNFMKQAKLKFRPRIFSRFR